MAVRNPATDNNAYMAAAAIQATLVAAVTQYANATSEVQGLTREMMALRMCKKCASITTTLLTDMAAHRLKDHPPGSGGYEHTKRNRVSA